MLEHCSLNPFRLSIKMTRLFSCLLQYRQQSFKPTKVERNVTLEILFHIHKTVKNIPNVEYDGRQISIINSLNMDVWCKQAIE